MKRSSVETRMAKSAKKKQVTQRPEALLQEEPERAPKGWPQIQTSIAESSGISLLLVEGYQPPALAIANNNSICEALQSSPDHVGLCDPFCGLPHSPPFKSNSITHTPSH